MRVATSLAVALLCWQALARAESQPQSPTAAAQQALPKFLLAVQERPSWASRYRVLVELGSGASKERFWLNDFRAESNAFSGQISSVPQVAEGLRLGQRVQVLPERILDWTYENPASRKISGHFHLCAEWASLPAEEAREQREYWGVLCDAQQ
jgi:uncharacterized protein YegJ (DUF2314 family)